ncbi:hypothetical protein CANCADRAFT_127685 [Tortispora caseinolytica NRRL Y-17796]|uniref:Uncharacterized protein n=1 Tax=Tortispora caseinolytica NRRL Y-17796 TaxID=767744 RepID=A0A1E4TAK5_9ASCO|nr:hypothetical protein CANCADRAFT_127685 [Tortispora caseinolytica NRRL Y-17796]
MSDFGRQGLGDKMESAVKPDSEKSYAEQAKDKAASAYESVAREVQPDSQKSNTQAATDALTGTKDDAKDSGESYLDKAKDLVADAQHKVEDFLNSNKK